MRIRAIEVRAAQIDGLLLALHAGTLAARTETDGHLTWEAVGWVPSTGSEIRDGVSNVVPIALDTDEGTFTGAAVVSYGAAGGSHATGGALRLIGVGALEPWPG